MARTKRHLATYDLDLNDYPLAKSISEVLEKNTSQAARAVFEVEAHPDDSLLPIEERAAKTAFSVEDYAEILKLFDRHPLVQRALFYQRIRNYAHQKRWGDLMLVRQWALDNGNGKLLLNMMKEMEDSALRLAEIDQLTLSDLPLDGKRVLDNHGQVPITIKPISAKNDNGKSKRD